MSENSFAYGRQHEHENSEVVIWKMEPEKWKALPFPLSSHLFLDNGISGLGCL